jgi:hypothetical protein
MPTRILRDGILDSERVDKLSDGGELFYRRLMSVVDDYGRFEADPVILRSKCYPRRTDRITVDQIESWLAELATELAVVYQSGRKRYLQLTDFGQRIRSEKSKYPGPPAENGWHPPTPADNDSKCPPTRARGRTESESESESDAKADAKADAETTAGGKTPPRRATAPEDRFHEIVAEYPNQTGIDAACRWYLSELDRNHGDKRKGLPDAILDGIRRWKLSAQWRDKQTGEIDTRFIPALHRFLGCPEQGKQERRMYLENPPEWKALSPKPSGGGRNSAFESAQ